MKHKIKIQGFSSDVGRNINVYGDGTHFYNQLTHLHIASDVEYESSDATSCIDLLVNMANYDMIELEADAKAIEFWPVLGLAHR
jgi:hypothetical protein